MTTITYEKRLHARRIADHIQEWFKIRGYETDCVGGDDVCRIKANKSGWIRTALAADRSFEVKIQADNEGTTIEVGHGDWTKNMVSNLVWYSVTGGTCLAVSSWSYCIKWELENYIRQLLPVIGLLRTDLSPC